MVSAYCGNTGTSGSLKCITRGSDGATATAGSIMKKDSRPKNSRHGKMEKGRSIPYGTLAGASKELRETYYYFGYKEDSMLPELPCPPKEEEPSIDPEEEVYKQELYECVKDVLDGLTPREAKILRMRFGVELSCDYTLEEIACYFDVTRERIRQIEAKALRKVKHPSRTDKLIHFLQNAGYYKTTEQRRREFSAKQQAWQEEKDKRERLHKTEKNMTYSKRKLWEELRPALEDTPWVRDLKTSKPDMYQELKELVGHLWGVSATEIWKTYTREKV